MKTINDKKIRRIKYLMSRVPAPYPFTIEMVDYLSGRIKQRPNDVDAGHSCLGKAGERLSLKIYREIFSLLRQGGVDVDSIDAVRSLAGDWASCYHRKGWHGNIYSTMPRPPRKDNKTYINRGGSFPPWPYTQLIRLPKKKRKTAWKRFYRLFPHLKKQG